MSLEKNLKTYRKAANFSQEKMAELLNVSRQAVTKWETGAGTPDITNLVAISKLFHVTIDELLSQSPIPLQQEFLFQSSTSYDIDTLKHFDIHLGGAHYLKLQVVNSEQFKVTLASNSLHQLNTDLKLKIDDSKSKLDVDINRFGKLTEAMTKKELSIFITLPQKYLRDVEITVNCQRVDLSHLVIEKFELDGKVKHVTIDGGQGEIELNSNLDMFVKVLSYQGTLSLNQISATSQLQVPINYDFNIKNQGFATKILFEEKHQKAEDFSNVEAENLIEFNGIKSELLIFR